MENFKVFRILNKLPKNVLDNFANYLESSYAKSNAHALELFQYYTNSRYNKNSENLDLEPSKIAKVCNELLTQVRRFLVLEECMASEDLQLICEQNAIAKLGLEELESVYNRRVNKYFNRTNSLDAQYYLMKYLIRKGMAESVEEQRYSVGNLTEIRKDLDTFYFAESLEHHLNILTQKAFVEIDFDSPIIEALLENLDTMKIDLEPIVIVNTYLFSIQREKGSFSHYFMKKDLFLNHVEKLSSAKAKEAYTFVANFCISNTNKGRKEFLAEAFYWYKKIIDHQLLLENDRLSQWKFNNINTIALRLKEYDWIEQFIHEYSEKLEDDVRQNSTAFALAQLHFYRKEFQNVLDQLIQVEFGNTHYRLVSSTMLLATYYELNEISALYSLGKSFRTFLNRKKKVISEKRRVNYLRFISFVTKLTKINQDESALLKLEEELKMTKGVASSQWLLDKIHEKLKAAVKR